MTTDTDFQPLPFTAGRLDARRIADDDKRLFEAHCQMARKGHGSHFALSLRGVFSAPFIVDQKGASKVLTMGVDTVCMLAVMPADRLSERTVVRTTNDGGHPDETVSFYRMADGSAWRSSPEYAGEMPDDLDCFRADVLAWAQKQFEDGVAHMARSQRFDRWAFPTLQSEIRRSIDEISDRTIYVPGHGRGTFFSASTPPRLKLTHYENSDTDVVIKLQKPFENLAQDWTGILPSMPAEVAHTAARVRWTVMYAMAGRKGDDFGPAFFEGWEDTVHRNGMMIRHDMASFAEIAERECDLFVRGVKSMAHDIVNFHQEGKVAFSDDTVAAAMLFNSPGVEFGSDEWDAAVETLATASESDDLEMGRFLEHAGWTLKVSPMLLVKAKTNLFIGRKLNHGLYDTGPEVARKADRGPTR